MMQKISIYLLQEFWFHRPLTSLRSSSILLLLSVFILAPVLTGYLNKRHLSTPFNSQTATSAPWPRPKNCRRTPGTRVVHLNKTTMNKCTISRQLDENRSTVGSIIVNWKKYKITAIALHLRLHARSHLVGFRWSWEQLQKRTELDGGTGQWPEEGSQ